MSSILIIGTRYIAEPWAAELSAKKPEQIIDEMSLRPTEGGEDRFVAYLMHLRFDGARHDAQGTTHEVGVFVGRDPNALAFTLQLRLKDDEAAIMLYRSLVQGVCHGNLPISKVLRSSEVARWEDVANHIISAVQLGPVILSHHGHRHSTGKLH
jgi:hypothetical protein